MQIIFLIYGNVSFCEETLKIQQLALFLLSFIHYLSVTI